MKTTLRPLVVFAVVAGLIALGAQFTVTPGRPISHVAVGGGVQAASSAGKTPDLPTPAAALVEGSLSPGSVAPGSLPVLDRCRLGRCRRSHWPAPRRSPRRPELRRPRRQRNLVMRGDRPQRRRPGTTP